MQRRERLLACPSCDCHVRAHERDCPHCGAPLRQIGPSTLTSAAAAAAGLTALALSALGPGGCGGNVSVESGGAGGDSTSMGGNNGGAGPTSTVVGTSTMDTTITTTTTTGVTMTTYGPGPTGPDDCISMPTFNDCAACFGQYYPEGAKLYGDLVSCVICDNCYTSCDGPTWGCAMPPAMKPPCDGDMPNEMACGDSQSGCISCGLDGYCVAQLDACQNNQDCVDYATAISDCPPPP